MKIVITGIAGFLGSHLAEQFIKEGHEVYGVDKLIGGDESNVPWKAKWLREVDCRELDSMKNLFHGADTVYHCAAYPHEGLSVFSPQVITDSIYGAGVSVMTAACSAKVRRVVNLSSMARYGDANGHPTPFRENYPVRPQDPYGIAKKALEDTMTLLGRIHGVDVIHAVPHNIIGPKQKYDDPFRNVASIFINRMLQAKQPIIYGDGGQRRCFSYVDDILPILSQMRTVTGFSQGEVFNVGPDEETVTILTLAQTIARILKFELHPIFLPERPGEVRYATCSADKIRKVFGYKTHWSLESALCVMIDAIRAKGPKPFSYYLPLEIISDQVPKTWSERIM